jgi:hypothetical protein
VLLYLFTNFFAGVFNSILWPLVGFIALPLTLLAYTYMEKINHPHDIVFLIIMFVAVVLDLGLLGHGEYRRRSR